MTRSSFFLLGITKASKHTSYKFYPYIIVKTLTRNRCVLIGLYYFSYSVGVLGQQNTLSNSLTMSVITTVFQRQLSSGLINLLSDPLNPTGAVDFVSRTLLVYLYPSDVVWFKSRNGSAYSDPVNWQIAFHAFLYSPIYSPKVLTSYICVVCFDINFLSQFFLKILICQMVAVEAIIHIIIKNSRLNCCH